MTDKNLDVKNADKSTTATLTGADNKSASTQGTSTASRAAKTPETDVLDTTVQPTVKVSGDPVVSTPTDSAMDTTTKGAGLQPEESFAPLQAGQELVGVKGAKTPAGSGPMQSEAVVQTYGTTEVDHRYAGNFQTAGRNVGGAKQKRALKEGEVLVTFLADAENEQTGDTYKGGTDVVMTADEARPYLQRQLASVSSIKDPHGPGVAANAIPAEADLAPVGQAPSTVRATVDRTGDANNVVKK